MTTDIGVLRERVAALEAQVQNKHKYQVLFERALDLLFVFDLQGYIKSCNHAVLQTLGYTLEELQSKPFMEFVHPDDQARSIAHFSSSAQENLTEAFHNRYVCKDGSAVHLTWRSIFNEERQEVFATARDITKLYLMDLERRRLVAITQNMRMGLLIYRLDDLEDARSLRLTSCNPAASKFVGGMELRPHIGQRIGEIFPGMVAHETLSAYRDVIVKQETLEVLNTSYQDENFSAIYDVRAFPLPDQQIAILFEDVTIKRQEEEMQRQAMIQNEIIRTQQSTLDELSTPLIPITDNILVMPLIGIMDSRRAQRVMDTLLYGVAETRGSIVVLDITGVSMVDTQVANVLIRAAESIKLLGAEAMITGIRPEVAQTLVNLGVDLSNLRTLSSLQSGIAHALADEARYGRR
jgi:rsbT co-antagonist protein RsbR